MWRVLAIVLWLWVALAASAGPVTASGWLDWLWPAGLLQSPAARPSDAARDLEAAVAHLGRLVPDATRRPLAGAASPEGHWRLVNAAGETFTAATPEEMARAVATLAPPPPADTAIPEHRRPAPPRLAVHIAADTVFRHPDMLARLPEGAELHVVVAGESRRLVWPGRVPGSRLHAVLRPRVVLAVGDRAAFEEALGLAEWRYDPAGLRLVGLEVGGPAQLARARRTDQASGRPLVDAIDPDRLRHALPALAGQTAVVTGRVARDLLHFQAGAGVERSILLGDLQAAADAADVNLVVVRSPSARQPGARNWLFLRNEPAGLDRAFAARTLADLIDALAANGQPLGIAVGPRRSERIALEIRPVDGLPGLGLGLPGVISEVAAGVTGRIPVAGLDVAMRSLAREREIAWRLVPGVPSTLQLAWGAGMLAGLLGLAAARGWFARVWSAEARADYGVAFGWHAARTVRGALFWMVFLPLAGVPAMLTGLLRLVLPRSPTEAIQADQAIAATDAAASRQQTGQAAVAAATPLRDGG